MATPEFIAHLRRSIGHDLLVLPGVAAIIVDDQGRVLMVRRSDTGAWQLPSGIVEPGEHPAETMVREVAEETGLEVTVDAIAAIVGKRRVVYPNGDECEFVTAVFRCTRIGGELRPDGEEVIEAGFLDRGAVQVVDYFDARGLPISVLDAGAPYFAGPTD